MNCIGITMGDPAGIGAEILVKALARRELYEDAVPLVIGDYEAVLKAAKLCGSTLKIRRVSKAEEAAGKFGTIDLMDLGLLRSDAWEYKKPQALCGEASYQYIARATELALAGEICAVVTGPINKEALNMGGRHFSGHTEILAKLTGTKNYAMLLTMKNLRVIHVTTHVPMREACDLIKKERVGEVIRLADESARLLGIERPRVAVAGLNPHSSEHGLFGREEEQEIIPAIDAARADGINVEGPVPPDTVFVKACAGMYDIVVAMYHDQGHIPIKLCGFGMDPATGAFTSVSGVNSTVGLPIIRTSVDHGTAYDKAGEGSANEESLVEAFQLALQMASAKSKQIF